jgi:hypothetical protein
MLKVVDEINQAVKRMRIIQRLLPRPIKKACNTHASPLPSWGQVKRLATEGKELLLHTLQLQTSEALFLAMVAILSCQVCGISRETIIEYTSPIPLFFILHQGMIPASRFLLMILLYWGALTLPRFLINGPPSIFLHGHFLLLCAYPRMMALCVWMFN